MADASSRLVASPSDPAPAGTASARCADDEFRVALVSMPFAAALRPSLQLGLLKPLAERVGFIVDTLHLHLPLARVLGLPLYSRLCEVRGLLGEWLFSIEAFGADAPDHDARFLRAFRTELAASLDGLDCPLERLPEIRNEVVPRYLDAVVESIAWDRYAVVGFTATFQQTLPSIALARRLKTRRPGVITIFGGANFESTMGLELVRAVPSIDYAVIGEGDVAFPELLAALRDTTDPGATPGVASRRNGCVRHVARQTPFSAMDDLPTPDYREFFDRAAAEGLLSTKSKSSIAIPFESSRGCWWGEKQHCTFCGLNGQMMSFRSKSASRVLAELDELHARYGSFRFESVDNIIDNRYYKTLLPRLAERGEPYTLFYEVKSNLSRERLRLLREAGVSRIQPGIESLSTRVLKLMRKGVSALQNVDALRWARYYGIHVDWNLLWGFPSETANDYRRQADLLPLLSHLQPANWGGRFWMERFSPAFTEHDAFVTLRCSPHRHYAYLFPREVRLEEVAYFFDYELVDALPDATYAAMEERLRRWQESWSCDERPSLTFGLAGGRLQVTDLRMPTTPVYFAFAGLEAELYLQCSEQPASLSQLQHRFSSTPPKQVHAAVEEFVRLGLMIRDRDAALSLAIPAVSKESGGAVLCDAGQSAQ